MKTIVVQIGNTDNKLTQQEWSKYVETMNHFLRCHINTVHFAGGSPTESPWQNYCWVGVAYIADWDFFAKHLNQIRLRFNQDSVAVTLGETQFI